MGSKHTENWAEKKRHCKDTVANLFNDYIEVSGYFELYIARHTTSK